MIVNYDIKNDSIVIDQRVYSRFLKSVIGVSGIILFSAGLILLIIKINDLCMQKFSHDSLLTQHFVLALGIAMILVRFSKDSMMNYSEKIIFSNKESSVLFFSSSAGDHPYVIPYSSIAFLRTCKKTGVADNPDIYSLEIIEKNGSVFWLTGFSSSDGNYKILSKEISLRTGLDIRDSSFETDNYILRPEFSYSSDYIPRKKNFFVDHRSSNGKTYINLKRPRFPFIKNVSVAVIYSFFFAVPFYIKTLYFNQDVPSVVHFFALIFIIIWIAILLTAILISLKDYSITLDNENLLINVSLKILPTAKYCINIPVNRIRNIRVNRFEFGTINISVIIDDNLDLQKSFIFKLINLSIYRQYKTDFRLHKNYTEITLWEIRTGSRPENAPDVFDLCCIADLIIRKIKPE